MIIFVATPSYCLEITNMESSSAMTESAKAMATRALRAISKSTVSALQLDSVPGELLYGTHVDLHRWSMILSDENLKLLSDQREEDRNYCLDCSSSNIFGMFRTFYQPHPVTSGLITLNLTAAKDISDYGIGLVARSSPNLKSLIISGCILITDVGVREVGMNCNSIQELNISSCPNIDGSGLTAIAELCRQLLKLDVSKCRSLQNWSLKKVFYECQKLEEINVSHLPKVGDEEIRVLAQNCPNVFTLIATECPYISDNSIQIVAEHCADLDLVDVSRTQMIIALQMCLCWH